MPNTFTYPGVYIKEKPSGVHAITGVATSIAAFVGYTRTGIDLRAKRILSFADYERSFGGLASDSEVSYAVNHFFQNGGTQAYVVRVPRSGAKHATVQLLTTIGGATVALELTALSAGNRGKSLIVGVDNNGITDTEGYNLTITDTDSGASETFGPVTNNSNKSNYVKAIVNDEDGGSKLVSVTKVGTDPPFQTGTVGSDVADKAGNLKTTISATTTLSLTVSLTVSTSPTPVIKDVVVNFIEVDSGGNVLDPVPTSVLGICRLLERKINQVLGAPDKQAALPGAAVTCTPATTSTGTAIRAVASADHPDVLITFGKGPAGADADAFLNLAGSANANVGHYWFGASAAFRAEGTASPGSDGTSLPQAKDLTAALPALDKVDLFNILCIPDATRAKVSDPWLSDLAFPQDQNTVFGEALTYCQSRRAFLIIDSPPEVRDVDTAADWISLRLTVRDPFGYAAAYFPRLRLPDPLNNMQLRSFAPCGVVANVYARIDAARGVWKAPAGVEATLNGVQGLVYNLTDNEQGVLNPLGLNCSRIFPVYGPVMWGARTIAGADALASEWKYVPVRRFALFLEESLYRGTKWAVFEPNDEPLWAQLRLNVGAFMHTLFVQGAFQGSTPQSAYFVKCDSETTTQDDINHGIVNILVGFAPLKPAEFVMIQIQQMAGQIPT